MDGRLAPLSFAGYGDQGGKGSKRTCKPGLVASPGEAMVIYLGRRLLDASSNLPGSRWRAGPTRGDGNVACSLFGLAPGGVYQASRVTPAAGALLPHLFTLTCGRRSDPSAVCFLRHFP